MKKHRFMMIYIAAYILLNLLMLDRFPFVHSDEPWLSGLSRNMLESGSIRVTETFFDLQPRYPHAIKTIFHLLQMPFMLLFGYHVFSFRLLSLLCGAGALWVFYLILRRVTSNSFLPALGVLLLSLDIQFLYASHFARQESMILLLMLSVFLALLKNQKHAVWIAAVLTGISIGVHPNSFLIAAVAGAMLVAYSIAKRKPLYKEIAIYTGITAVFAAAFIGLSYMLDKDFIRHYFAYGAEFQIQSSLADKFLEIFPYFQRLYYGVSGTYYTPDIRFQLWLFLAAVLIAVALLFTRHRERLYLPLCAILGLLLGMTLVGRFNQPYVVFFFPLAYLLLIVELDTVQCKKYKRARFFCAALLIFLICASASRQIIPIATSPAQYSAYISEIAAFVPKSARTIGNLNAEYYFDNGALLDYRNLTHIRGSGLRLQEYIEQNDVKYIILSDELQFIHRLRPQWNGIYGNINFLEELTDLLKNRCTLVHSFIDNQYGVRIVRYQNTEIDFTIRIYRYLG